MVDKLYIWRIRLRGHPLWCHATDPTDAIRILSEQTGEPLEDYGLVWEEPKNLDGTPVTEAERARLYGYDDLPRYRLT